MLVAISMGLKVTTEFFLYKMGKKYKKLEKENNWFVMVAVYERENMT